MPVGFRPWVDPATGLDQDEQERAGLLSALERWGTEERTRRNREEGGMAQERVESRGLYGGMARDARTKTEESIRRDVMGSMDEQAGDIEEDYWAKKNRLLALEGQKKGGIWGWVGKAWGGGDAPAEEQIRRAKRQY